MDVMTKHKVVPKLRFGEFDGKWKKIRFSDITIVNPKSSELPNSFIYVDLDSVTKGILTKKNRIYKFSSPSRAQRVLVKGDIIYQTVRPYQKNNYYFNLEGNYVASTGYAQLRTKEISQFIYQLLHTDNFVKKVIVRCTGTSYPAINSSDLKSISINIPSLPEQQKIASFLSAVDKKIQQQTKKKDLLEAYKKGIMQKIFSQELRFKDDNGNNFPDWEEKRLEDVLFEHKLKSTGEEEVYSVSVHKGLINQIEHLGRSFSAKNTDHYNLVKPNDIVYTKSPTGEFPYGIIKQAKINKDVIVSPLYGVFTPESENLGYMFDIYFESKHNVHNYLHSIIQKGAKNTINITNSTFLSKSLRLPIDFEEQKKIANFFSSIDKKIDLVSTQIEKTKAFKKGLLQQMFV